jgi:SAM-dependent methyltransferase
MLRSHHKTIFETLGRHPIHPFPARMAPGIALEALGESQRPLRVLDPMAGSGTVLAVARANGHRAYGVDLDPLAVLLAGVWTRTIDSADVTDKAEEVLSRARARMKTLPVSQAFPSESDDETRSFIRYWFDSYVRRQLTALASSIKRTPDSAIREALWCGFSRLIIAKQAGASLALDLSHSRPHKKFERAPIKPFDRFLSAVDMVVSNCPQKNSGTVGPAAIARQGDARNLEITDSSIDLVLTSPPYLNAIDYLRCSKFSLVWMGHAVQELRQIRARSVGTEASAQLALDTEWVQTILRQLRIKPALSTRDHALLSTYAWDMGHAMAEVSRVLKRGGRAVYVVGDSTIRGTFIRNSNIVAAVASRTGLSMVSRQARNLPANRRYLPPPALGADKVMMNGRMRREVVVEFTKP